jgi:hypothetical protein
MNAFACASIGNSSKWKKGHHYSAGRKGGVLCAPKNKKTKYYEIRRQGKTKLYFKYSENKLKFNLKKREFTRSRPSLLSRLRSFFVRPHAPSTINHQPSNSSTSPAQLVSDQPLSIINRLTPPITHHLIPTLCHHPLSRASKFKTLKQSKAIRLDLSPSLLGLPQGKILCGQVSSFWNCQPANNDDVIAFQLKSAGWDAMFSALPSRTQKSRERQLSRYFVVVCIISEA